MSAPIRFLFRGQPVAVPADTPTRTVLQWLREDRQACGTKEGCAEGDCGACTVLVAELPETLPEGTQAVLSAGLALRPVNACIRFLPTLHGKALLTVEDLASGSQADTVSLHPAQQALVDCHGAQCGFCTPGFVMTLAAVHEAHQTHQDRDPTACAPSRGALADALSGNLCRCTGYRPILDAAQQMLAQTGPRLPLAGLRDQLLALQAAPAPSVEGLVHVPRDLASLARLRADKPEARLVAGATDVGLWVTKQMRPLGELIFLGDVAELRRIEATATALRIGAAVTLEDAWAALVARWPALHEMHRRFAGPPVRHAGTLVGNLANGSPIGDGPPVLIALGAELLLRRGEAQRRLPLQDFYLDYMKNALQPGEFVEALAVPLPGPDWVLRGYKIAKRYDSDISAVCAVLALQLEGERIVDARLAYGGMAAIVKRAGRAEAALRGRDWDERAQQAAADALAEDFQPLSDLRASSAYRMNVAQNLLRRFWLETRLHEPLAPAQTSVWQAVNLAAAPGSAR